MSLEHTLSDGTVEQATSLLDAYQRCPFLGRMTLEQAAVFVEIYERDDSILKQNEEVESVVQTSAPEASVKEITNDTKVSEPISVRPAEVVAPILESATSAIEPVNVQLVELLRQEEPLTLSVESPVEKLVVPQAEVSHIDPPPKETIPMVQEVEVIIAREIPPAPKLKPELKPTLVVEPTKLEAITAEPSLDLAQADLPPEATIETDFIATTTEEVEFVESSPQLELPSNEVAEIISLDIDDLIMPDETMPLTQSELEQPLATATQEVESPISEAAQTLATIITELEPVKQTEVRELLTKLETLVFLSEEEPEAQELNLANALDNLEEAEQLEIVEALIKLLDLDEEEIEPRRFLKLLIQVLPELELMLNSVDLEHDGTKEAKRKHFMSRGDDPGWATLRIGQIIGMLVLLRSFVILPGEIY